MILNLIKSAIQLFYDNSKSGLSATNTQDAIDEIQENIKQLNTNIDTLSSISTHSVSSIHPWILNTYVNQCYKYGKSFTINFMFLNGDTVLSANTTIGKIPYTLPMEQKVILYNKNGDWASAKVDTNGNIILSDAVSAKTTYNLESTVYVNV